MLSANNWEKIDFGGMKYALNRGKIQKSTLKTSSEVLIFNKID